MDMAIVFITENKNSFFLNKEHATDARYTHWGNSVQCEKKEDNKNFRVYLKYQKNTTIYSNDYR